jgi:hypothetical protein
MKKKIPVYAFCAQHVHVMTKVYWVLQKLCMQLSVTSAVTNCVSLIIDVNKGKAMPAVHVWNTKTLT